MLVLLSFYASLALLVPSSPAAAWNAIGRATASVLLVERPVSVLRLSGTGRRDFLHGLCTADVKTMKDGDALDAAVVDSSGSTLELLSLAELNDRLLAIGSSDRGAANLAFFERYVFPLDPVEVADVSDAYESGCFELHGPSATAVLAGVLGTEQPLPDAGSCVPLRGGGGVCCGGSSLRGSTSAAPAYTLLLEHGAAASATPAALAAAVARAGGVCADWAELRIACGRPAVGSDFDAPPAPPPAAASALSDVGAASDEEVASDAAGAGRVPPRRWPPVATPLELGLWKMVHLDKGCYLGQEVIARVARAKRPRRELFGVQFDAGTSPTSDAVGAPVTTAEGGATAVGTLTSLLHDPAAAEPIDAAFGLALVKASAAKVGARVAVGGASGALVDLPFASRVGQQAGGVQQAETPEQPPTAAADAKAAEAERKAAKLAAMQAKLAAFQARQQQAGGS